MFDYSEEQLKSECKVAGRERYDIKIIRGDMTKRLPFEAEYSLLYCDKGSEVRLCIRKYHSCIFQVSQNLYGKLSLKKEVTEGGIRYAQSERNRFT